MSSCRQSIHIISQDSHFMPEQTAHAWMMRFLEAFADDARITLPGTRPIEYVARGSRRAEGSLTLQGNRFV
jgi:hypothetical protein